MKSVLISIQPKWCELIASGKKMVEVRKTKPKLETPFKVYIYRTKGFVCHLCGGVWWNMPVGGTVIGEFVCNKIDEFIAIPNPPISVVQLWQDACLTKTEFYNYFDNSFNGYGWHISDLVIYDEPKELREFYHACTQPSGTDCAICLDRAVQKCWQITRPPQSWCYVEEGR